MMFNVEKVSMVPDNHDHTILLSLIRGPDQRGSATANGFIPNVGRLTCRLSHFWNCTMWRNQNLFG